MSSAGEEAPIGRKGEGDEQELEKAQVCMPISGVSNKFKNIIRTMQGVCNVRVRQPSKIFARI